MPEMQLLTDGGDTSKKGSGREDDMVGKQWACIL